MEEDGHVEALRGGGYEIEAQDDHHEHDDDGATQFQCSAERLAAVTGVRLEEREDRDCSEQAEQQQQHIPDVARQPESDDHLSA